MKNLAKLLMMVVAAICLMAPMTNQAEAAKVAVLPLAISDSIVADKNSVNTENMTQLYWDVAVDLFRFPDFDFVDDDAIAKALNNQDLKAYDQATLEKIATDTGADVVVAMRLDQFTSKTIMTRQEPVVQLKIKGEFSSMNKVTGKYYHKSITESPEVDEVLTVRSNFENEEFGKLVKRYMNRAIAVK